MDKCPVCGENTKEAAGAIEYSYHEKKLLFCSLACLRIFQQFPEVYLSESEDEISILEDSRA
jgi:YHS domain-containing protein